MTRRARVQRDVQRGGLVAALIALVGAGLWFGGHSFRSAVSATGGDPQAAVPSAGSAGSEEAARQEFQRRLNDYLNLRTDLSKKLKPLSTTADSAELAGRQEALAAAIRAARKGAKPGDLIPTGVAGQIRAIVAADFKDRSPDARRAAFSEVPEGLVLTINREYPANAALPTLPPLLLNKLPILPDNLQYRFAGRHMVILDADTEIIIDYITNVLPAH